MTKAEELLALLAKLQRGDSVRGFSPREEGLLINALRLAAQADAQGGEVVAWRETAASWLERKADLATNSLHCGDSSMTIHSTHRYAAGLMALAKEIRETATPQAPAQTLQHHTGDGE